MSASNELLFELLLEDELLVDKLEADSSRLLSES